MNGVKIHCLLNSRGAFLADNGANHNREIAHRFVAPRRFP